MERKNRENGVLCPLASLPSPYGIGNLGKSAYQFIDFLASCKVNIWQLLPLTLTSYGDSPYQSPSATGLSYYYIDPDTLIEKGLLTKKEASSFDFGSDERRINYGLLFHNRISLLKLAFTRFDTKDAAFQAFLKKGKYHDFAFFLTLKSLHNFTPWYSWDEKDKFYTPELEKEVLAKNKPIYLFYQWTQFEFENEYQKLKEYANKKNIRLMGDMPLYVALDSVEAYKYSSLFLLDENKNPTVVAGCPPDYFNADGQLWGNPIYNWEEMKKDGYAWWNKRIENNLELFDILRIDHFRGIAGYYTIPYGDKTARNGKWVTGPGKALFEGKENLPIVAEDLGFIDKPVKDLLAATGYPGMKVLEFAFDGDPKNDHKPSNAKYNYICYSGTHDNSPILGYLESLKPEELEVLKKDVAKECNLFAVPYADGTLKELSGSILKLVYASPCRLAIVPLWDLTFKNEEARINRPSVLSDKNWTFRFTKADFDKELKDFLSESIHTYRP